MEYALLLKGSLTSRALKRTGFLPWYCNSFLFMFCALCVCVVVGGRGLWFGGNDYQVVAAFKYVFVEYHGN